MISVPALGLRSQLIYELTRQQSLDLLSYEEATILREVGQASKQESAHIMKLTVSDILFNWLSAWTIDRNDFLGSRHKRRNNYENPSHHRPYISPHDYSNSMFSIWWARK